METLHENMVIVHESYTNLDHRIDGLKTKTKGIEDEIVKVGDEMSSRMDILQSKADDIGNVAGQALDKQKQLLDGLAKALVGLQLLGEFQSHALEESRGNLKEMAQFGHEQQEELLTRQKQLQQTHDHLETFESKQASMFLALDKLFTLHKAMLLESRAIKAFLLYSVSIFLLYMFTSTKQMAPDLKPAATQVKHGPLYKSNKTQAKIISRIISCFVVGLALTFLVELTILRYGTNEMENQAWILSIVRSLFVQLASCQLLYSIWTYRNTRSTCHGKWKTRTQTGVDWSSWVEAELPEDVDKLKDPDVVFPEEVAENFSRKQVNYKKIQPKESRFDMLKLF
ncbi:hypothetical protein T459_29849 [Capsicum annuum]|uniref:Protein GAMETE EXPRESSED 1 n=1 Tax=Capsicum annuum TaxID=4072 RepID=A0A2G2Y6Q9_CAPAN|nr:hypothetical protein T459_29849 [Capsicum annuum]